MKLSKLAIALLVALVVVCLATSVNAFSNEDLKTYLTGDHTIRGVAYKLNYEQRDAVINRLNTKHVTDEQAAQIKAIIESVKADIEKALEDQNVNGMSELNDETQAKVFAKVQSAANVAGVDLVADKDGNITAKDSKTGEVLSQVAKSELKNVFPQVVFAGSAPADTVGGAASTSTGNGSSTVSVFAKTGSAVPVYAIVSLIALVAVSAYFVKKVNA